MSVSKHLRVFARWTGIMLVLAVFLSVLGPAALAGDTSARGRNRVNKELASVAKFASNWRTRYLEERAARRARARRKKAAARKAYQVAGRKRKKDRDNVDDTPAPQAKVVGMRVLVVSPDGLDPALPAAEQALGFVGIPYDVWIASEHPGEFTSDKIAGPDAAYYQGIILTEGQLSYTPDGGQTWRSAFSGLEWMALWDYQTKYDVRLLAWYTYPTPDYGFSNPIEIQGVPYEAFYTAAGGDIFSYANTANSIDLLYTWTYAGDIDEASTAILEDASGNTLAAQRTHLGGRETLALTFDSSVYTPHSAIISYGLLNWVTKGIFLGHRKVYLGVQVDDILIDNNIFGTDLVYRMTGDDLEAVLAWQEAKQERPITKDFVYHMVFNGEGIDGYDVDPDTLVPAVRQHRLKFQWINHTFTHLNLNDVDYPTAWWEIHENFKVASDLRLRRKFSPRNMVTPEISGLYNPEFLQAAHDLGIRYLVTDTSQPGQNNPSPNAGIYNQFQPDILMIPRYPNNLFTGVSTPEEWEYAYNFVFGAYWGRDLSIAEILDIESSTLVGYMLRGDTNPWMFHAANMRAYDGAASLLSDLLDMTLAKYERAFNLPILSPPMHKLGAIVANRMKCNAVGVNAWILNDSYIAVRTTNGPAKVPITGVRYGRKTEVYGGQDISYVGARARRWTYIPIN